MQPSLERLRLERTKYALRNYLQEELFLDVEIDTYVDQMLRNVVYEFRTAIWSDKLPEETKTAEANLSVATWTSAWQLWKANHADSKLFGWIAKRWPPEKRGTETHTASVSFNLSKSVLFPDFKPYPSNLGSPYLTVAMTEPVWKWSTDV